MSLSSSSRRHVAMNIVDHTTAQIMKTAATSTLALCVEPMLYEFSLFWYTARSPIFSARHVNIGCRCRNVALLER